MCSSDLWKLKEGVEAPFTLYELADRLRARGWQVPAYSLPADLTQVVVQRALVRHGVSRDLANLLLDDVQRALAYFERRSTAAAGEESRSGFHH